MARIALEHVNITVSDPAATARLLQDVFGWEIRWSGPAKLDGHTIHVGEKDTYLAIYAKGDRAAPGVDTYETVGGLNHIGVVVDNLDAVEQKVLAAGLKTHSHADYEPGRRFYFHDPDGIEFEVASYT